MENQYLSYDEYKELGGLISDINSFNLLEYKARKEIDDRTYGRLIGSKVSEDVKMCMYELINELPKYAKQENGSVVSESVGSYSVSYAQVDSKVQRDEISNIIKTYLANEKKDGKLILYFL